MHRLVCRIVHCCCCRCRRPSRCSATKAALVTATAVLLLLLNYLQVRPSLVGSDDAAEIAVSGSADEASGDEASQGNGGGRFRRIRQHLAGSDAASGPERSVTVEAWSGGGFTALAIDGVLLVNQTVRGLHVFIVNQATASLMGHHVFDRLDQLKPLVAGVTPGRILVLTSVPPFRNIVSTHSSSVLRMLGSGRTDLGSSRRPASWGRASAGAASEDDATSWVLISFAKIGRIAEKSLSNGRPLTLRTRVHLVSDDEPICPSWPIGEETARRRQFCRLADGFSNVCDCGRPTVLTYQSKPRPWSTGGTVPLTVMSSNRPQFLFRSLTSLLALPSLNVSQTHVMLRGFFDEPRLICDLLRLPYTQRKLVSPSLANLYRLGLADAFHLFPTAQYAILFEDDVDPSPDLVQFFNRTLPLMSRDPDLFCIGAWNDQSFTHTTAEPGLLHRTQQVPLKAVAIRRSTWESQLNEQWPEGPVDLPSWLTILMGPRRYCLRPALSRAFVYSQSLRLIDRLRPAYRTSADEFHIDEEAHRNYDSRLQDLIDKSVSLNVQFARNCQTAVLRATTLASKSNSTLPSLMLTVRVSHRRGAQALWRRVARCFSLNASLTCLYKGTCQINFQRFILIVVFRPMAQFRLPANSPADLVLMESNSRSQHHRRMRHRGLVNHFQ